VKPLRLEVEGFTAFKTRQAIDLAGLRLFAIFGPTGAGKSSLLDAITYALYGQVPRLGGQGYQEIIAHGAPRLCVTLDFEVSNRHLRAVRALKRGGTTTAQLVELDPRTGEEQKPLAGRVREVDLAVQELLGLDYRTFAQAVVLPQGKFQQFLAAKPAERREILSNLLRLGRYERMRKAAQERHAEANTATAQIERRLAEDYAGVDADAVARLVAEVEALGEEVERAARARTVAEATLQEAREVAQLARDLAEKERALADLERRGEAVARDRARLDAARHAARLRDVFANLDAARALAEQAAAKARRAQAACEAAAARHGNALRTLASARQAAAQVPALRERVAALDQVLGVLPTLARSEARATSAARQADEAGRKATEARKAAERAERALADARAALEAANARRAQVSYAPERAAAIRELVPAAREAQEHASRHAALVRQAAEARATAEARAADASRLADAAAKAARAAADARRAAEDAARALREEHRRQHALVLRKELRAGEPCPVCEQPVGERPRMPRAAEKALARAETAEADAREHAGRADEAARRAEVEAGKAEAAAQEAAKHAATLGEEADRARTALEACAAALREAVAARADLALPAEPDAILAAEAELARAQQAWEQAEDAVRKAERAFDQATAACERQRREVEACTAAQEAAAAAHAEAAAERDQLAAQVRAVAGDRDPTALRAELHARAEELGAAERAAHDACTRAETELRAAHEQEAAAAAEHEAATARAHNLAAAARERCAQAGFADEAAARAALLADEEIDALDAALRAHDAEKQALARDAAALRRKLGGRTADLAACTAACEAAARAHAEASERRASAATRLDRLRNDLARAEELRTELARKQADAATFGTLARELRSDGFLDWLLAESLRELVQGASVRLRELSDRYTLDLRDGEFCAVDHDNGGELRSADTLSGGETFLTSLALALELSEQVQATAGAVRLDSLFIDEGFGTLDAETLETVASAIESLQRAGRMVGIITHVAELTERMPARIQVVKGPDGSRVEVVRTGG